MTTVKFDKAVKYKGVRYPAHVVFKADDEDVDKLKKAGATVLSTETITPPADELEGKDAGEADNTTEGQEGTNDEDVDKLKEELLDYTIAQLTEFAEKRGIDIQGKTRKADIYNIIVASLN